MTGTAEHEDVVDGVVVNVPHAGPHIEVTVFPETGGDLIIREENENCLLHYPPSLQSPTWTKLLSNRSLPLPGLVLSLSLESPSPLISTTTMPSLNCWIKIGPKVQQLTSS